MILAVSKIYIMRLNDRRYLVDRPATISEAMTPIPVPRG